MQRAKCAPAAYAQQQARTRAARTRFQQCSRLHRTAATSSLPRAQRLREAPARADPALKADDPDSSPARPGSLPLGRESTARTCGRQHPHARLARETAVPLQPRSTRWGTSRLDRQLAGNSATPPSKDGGSRTSRSEGMEVQCSHTVWRIADESSHVCHAPVDTS